MNDKEINWLLQEKYQGHKTAEFKKDLKRLEDGEPLDYVIGFSQFLGCKIDVSKKPLIPRTETEYWVGQAIEDMKAVFGHGQKPLIQVLDIFAGSGCIGVSIMRHVPEASVTFAEHQNSLLEQIEINCQLNSILKERYEIIKSDIFSNVTGKFDYIFANPPYIPDAQKNTLEPSVIKYEPTQALFGGEDGLLYIRKFLAQAKNFLTENGKIYLEFDSFQKPAIEKLCKELKYHETIFFQDQYGKDRWVVVS